MTDTAISPLRRRMIEDMTIRQLGAKIKLATSGPSRTSPISLDMRLTAQPSKTSAAISCISRPATSASPASTPP